MERWLNRGYVQIEPKLLYHCAPELRRRLQAELAKEQKDNDLVFEIQAALQAISEDFAKDEENIQSLLSSGRITFDTLWAIVPPNEPVYTLDSLSEPCVYRAVNSGVWKNHDGSVVFYILGRMVDSDGKSLGWTRSKTLEIPIFTGEKTITDLPVYPLRFHEESAQMRQKLIERGRRRIRLQQQGFYEYSGSGVRETETPLGLTRKEKFNVGASFRIFLTHHILIDIQCRGRIVIDPAAFSEIEPENGFVPEIRHAISKDQLLRDDELVAMPSVVYGFSLTQKTWGAFAVSRITKIEWNTSVWDSLVLPDTSKRLVRTLVKSHISHGAGFDDFVRGKGRGLVGLLAGPPGVGKTLTAEAVAETVQRPLYMLSSGELGSDPDSIDQRLQTVFRLAQTWKAVLLLDEADVFMAKRTDLDLTRNAIVSIFLRQLEYYQGILILTTNRVEEIDDAFRSRIHFQLSFPELDSVARRAIWRGFLENVNKDGGIAVELDEPAIDRLADMDMNGRQ
ncbi:ATP-dependent zinc metalloprotease YME1, partial [Madurella mycetomatis]